MIPYPVTAHAVLRYLTRIEDFDLRPLVRTLGRDAGNHRLVAAAAESLGTTFEELKRCVLPEPMAPLVRSGVRRIRIPGMVLVCADAVVVTVETDLRTRKATIRTAAEYRRERGKRDRRK